MKIVLISNYDDESVSQKLIAENVSEYNASLICKIMNRYFGESASMIYEMKPDDYILYTFQP